MLFQLKLEHSYVKSTIYLNNTTKILSQFFADNDNKDILKQVKFSVGKEIYFQQNPYACFPKILP